MKNGKKYTLAGYISRFAILLALVIVLQVFASGLKIGTVTFSFVLIPIVLGGMTLGVLAGSLLGLAFGVVTLVAGVTGADPFTMILFNDHPFYTALICLVKGTSAGAVSAVLYKFIKIKNRTVVTFVSAAAAPIVNTGLFILGALSMVSDTLINNFVSGTTVIYFLVIGCAGINFLVELGLNLIACPALERVVRAVDKGYSQDFGSEDTENQGEIDNEDKENGEE